MPHMDIFEGPRVQSEYTQGLSAWSSGSVASGFEPYKPKTLFRVSGVGVGFRFVVMVALANPTPLKL